MTGPLLPSGVGTMLLFTVLSCLGNWWDFVYYVNFISERLRQFSDFQSNLSIPCPSKLNLPSILEVACSLQHFPDIDAPMKPDITCLIMYKFPRLWRLVMICCLLRLQVCLLSLINRDILCPCSTFSTFPNMNTPCDTAHM